MTPVKFTVELYVPEGSVPLVVDALLWAQRQLPLVGGNLGWTREWPERASVSPSTGEQDG